MSGSVARDRLLFRLRRDAYRAGTFTLASGRTSDFFIDCKRVVLSAEGHTLVGEAMYEIVAEHPTQCAAIAGVALGGCPLASAVSLVSYQRGRPLDALYVRKEAKDHGTRAQVEGYAPAGTRVALLEDVLTTGGSSRVAIDKLREAGFEVPLVVTLIDRAEGGRESLTTYGVQLVSLFRREDFVRPS